MHEPAAGGSQAGGVSGSPGTSSRPGAFWATARGLWPGGDSPSRNGPKRCPGTISCVIKAIYRLQAVPASHRGGVDANGVVPESSLGPRAPARPGP